MRDVRSNAETAEAIFVFAGRESRKRFGLQLFREGAAPRLVLSVGRFEWRRFASLGLTADGGLTDLVSETAPERRHFFVDIRAVGARCERVPKGALGTWSEIRALARLVEGERIGSLIVISHQQHLRRCLLGLRLALPDSCVLIPIASSPDDEEPAAGGWMETAKFLFYSALLRPIWLGARFISSRLRRGPFPDIKDRFTLSQPGLREGDFRPPEVARTSSPLGTAADRRAHH